jgi:PAS domain S-box-containing protein
MRSNWYSNDFLLEEKNGFYRKLLNQIPDLIFQLTINSTNDFYFSYVNSSMLSFFEISPLEIDENPTKIISSRIFPEDKEGFFESLFESKKQFIPWSYEFRVQIGNNDIIWLKVDANIEVDDEEKSIFFGRLSDITSIKKRELKIVESEERYHFALEASKSGVWDYNLKTGEVYLSKESLQIIQCNTEDKITTNSLWDERIHPDDLESYLQSIELHKQNKTPFFENAKRVIAKDGTYKWVLSRGKIIDRDKNNVPLRIIGIHTDVTLEKEKEAQLIGNFDIISEQNNRLLNFAHIVSHNLRSHTGNFKMLLNIIDSDDNQETRDECFNHLKTTSQALSDTIEHLKELVDIHSTIIHKKENLNLSIYLNRTLNVLNNEIKDNKVEIINDIDKNATINFNPAYLESILLNITTNAIKYSHPDRNPIINYSFIIENNKQMLLIRDNGLGINLEKYGEKLFGMYKTFHKNTNARGIGLFITKNQIESMGGTIEVESKVNVGSTFKIKFNE